MSLLARRVGVSNLEFHRSSKDRTRTGRLNPSPSSTWHHVPGFLGDTLRIRRQLSDADGLVGYALNAQLSRKTFWTYSVWTDQESLQAFAAADPHRQIVQRLRSRMNDSQFEFLNVQGSEIQTRWGDMMEPVR